MVPRLGCRDWGSEVAPELGFWILVLALWLTGDEGLSPAFSWAANPWDPALQLPVFRRLEDR